MRHAGTYTEPPRRAIAQPFIVCDKRSDINRVAVPISRLEQWQASGIAITDLTSWLARLAPS